MKRLKMSGAELLPSPRLGAPLQALSRLLDASRPRAAAWAAVMSLAGLWLAVGSACIEMPTRVPDSERCRMDAPGACTPEVCAAYDADLPAGCLADATGGADGMGQGDIGQADVGPAGDTGPQEVGTPDTGPDTETGTAADTGSDTGPDAAPECVLDADCAAAAACQVATCQDGACVEGPAEDNIPCDDGDACTEGDHCVAGVCQGAAKACDDGVACTADACDAGTGQCLHDNAGCACSPETAAADCDDGNPCTADACVDGACSSTPTAEGQGCDDGSVCTEGDTCQGGVCTGQAKDCSDGLSCSVDVCDAGTGQCLHDTSACQCTADADCDDGDPCTVRTCSAAGACETADAPSSTSCDDGDACTVGDHCAAGVCGGQAKDCSDGLSCSVDVCDAGTGQCLHDTSACGCTAAADCDDGNACTTEACSAAGACETADAPSSTSCDDGDACTLDDHCAAGVCAGSPKACDDGIACTADSCDGGTGQCVHDATGCGCAPGSAAVDCDDGNPCTADTCTQDLQCAHTPLTGGGVACSDADPCTTGDACQAGVCQGVAKTCDDGLACTVDSCDPASGQCVTDDTACECLAAADCDDHEPCTSDVCQPDRTCAHTPLPDDMACQGDGSVTGSAEAPVSGACSAGVCRGVLDVAVGMFHACAVSETGGVWCWGVGSAYLGTGDADDHPTPVPVDLGSGPNGTATAVAAGAVHTCVLVQSGAVRCWGGNQHGELGAGDTVDRDNSPAHPASLVSFGPAFLEVSARGQATCASRADGRVACWGWGDGGVLGSGDTKDRMNVASGLYSAPALQDLGATEVGTSDAFFTKRHTCALVAGGDVRCWGQGAYGALGTGATQDIMDEAGEVPSLLALAAVKLSVGWTSSCVVTATGAVRCWGAGGHGVLGSGSTEDLMDQPGEAPSTVPLPAPAVDVAVGSAHACAIVAGGDVYCWGEAHRLGAPAGSGTGDLLDQPGEEAYHVDLGAGQRAVRITADANATCVVLASKQVKCWGADLGDPPPWLGYGDGAYHPDPPAAYVNVMGAPGSQCADGAACLSGTCQTGVCQ